MRWPAEHLLAMRTLELALVLLVYPLNVCLERVHIRMQVRAVRTLEIQFLPADRQVLREPFHVLSALLAHVLLVLVQGPVVDREVALCREALLADVAQVALLADRVLGRDVRGELRLEVERKVALLALDGPFGEGSVRQFVTLQRLGSFARELAGLAFGVHSVVLVRVVSLEGGRVFKGLAAYDTLTAIGIQVDLNVVDETNSGGKGYLAAEDSLQFVGLFVVFSHRLEVSELVSLWT